MEETKPVAIKPIYAGKPENFHWVGFGSGTGTNLRECAKVKKPSLIVCDNPKAGLLELDALKGVERLIYNGFRECGSFKDSRGNPELEQEYQRKSGAFNAKLLDDINSFEEQVGYKIDLIVLGGYNRIITDPLLKAYQDKIINVHPADLTLLDEDHRRRFIGLNAVYDALSYQITHPQASQQPSTLSSIILVDEGEDHGEILARGKSVEMVQDFTANNLDLEKLREYADIHQRIQKPQSDWPALTTVLLTIMHGKLGISEQKMHHNDWRMIYMGDTPLPYGGFGVGAP